MVDSLKVIAFELSMFCSAIIEWLTMKIEGQHLRSSR